MAMLSPRRWWFLLLMLSALQLAAEPGNIQVAYELEIDVLFAGALAPYFDLDADERKATLLVGMLPDEAPTLEARTVAQLPESVRNKVLEGFTLQDLEAPSKPSPSGLIGLGGAPLTSTSPLDTVNRRWKRLWQLATGRGDLAAWVPARALPRSTQAALLMKMLQDRQARSESTPRLRDQAESTEIPPIFEGLRWHRDGAQLEFTDLKPSTDLTGTLARWKRLASLANVSRAFDEAKDTSAGAGYHLNISVHGPVERDLTEFAHLYQNRYLVDAVLNGKGEKLFRLKNLVGYQPDVRKRGIVRLKNGNFLEVRAHFKPAQEELKELTSLLQMPAEKAHEVLARETNGQLTAEVIRSLGKVSPRALYHVIDSTERALPPGEAKFPLSSEAVKDALKPEGKIGVERVLDLIQVGTAARERGQSAGFLRGLSKILRPAIDAEVITALLGDSRPIPEVAEILHGVVKKNWNRDVGLVALKQFPLYPLSSRLHQLFTLAGMDAAFEKDFKAYLLSETAKAVQQDDIFDWRSHLPFFSRWMKSPEAKADSVLRQKIADCILGLRMKPSDRWVAPDLYDALEGTDREAIAPLLRTESKKQGPTRRLLLEEFALGTLPPSLVAYVSKNMDDWDSDREALLASVRSKPAHLKLLQKKLYGQPRQNPSPPCSVAFPRLHNAE